MAIDCYQIFLKGQGVYCKFDSLTHPSNLHLIYEILPMAYLFEKAGGKTDDSHGNSILEIKISGFGQRISFLAGSVFEVNKLTEMIKVPNV